MKGSNTKNTRALFLIYLHLSEISDNIKEGVNKEGVKVEKGDCISKVGKEP